MPDCTPRCPSYKRLFTAELHWDAAALGERHRGGRRRRARPGPRARTSGKAHRAAWLVALAGVLALGGAGYFRLPLGGGLGWEKQEAQAGDILRHRPGAFFFFFCSWGSPPSRRPAALPPAGDTRFGGLGRRGDGHRGRQGGVDHKGITNHARAPGRMATGRGTTKPWCSRAHQGTGPVGQGAQVGAGQGDVFPEPSASRATRSPFQKHPLHRVHLGDHPSYQGPAQPEDFQGASRPPSASRHPVDSAQLRALR